MITKSFQSDQAGFTTIAERIAPLEGLPVFMQPGWMTATSGDVPWGGVILEDDARIHGLLLYRIVKKYGITYLSKPALSQYLGPWVQGMPESEYAKRSRENQIYAALIEGLPKHNIFHSNFHPDDTNWIPFYWENFKQTTRYSYRVNLQGSAEEIFSAFTRKRRSEIKKACKKINVTETADTGLLIELNRMTYARQGEKPVHSSSIIDQSSQWLLDSGNGTILVARDTDGAPHSCMLIGWDQRGAYGIVQGENPDLRNSGASMAVINTALEMAIDRGAGFFDYCGSMVPRLEFVRRSCGGVQTPYSSVWRIPSKPTKLLMHLTGYPFRP